MIWLKVSGSLDDFELKHIMHCCESEVENLCMYACRISIHSSEMWITNRLAASNKMFFNSIPNLLFVVMI